MFFIVCFLLLKNIQNNSKLPSEKCVIISVMFQPGKISPLVLYYC